MMYDIDPASPVLRLTSPQSGTQPTLKTNAQHLAQHTQSTKPRAHIAEGIEAHWARLHTNRQTEIRRAFRASTHGAEALGQIIQNYRALAETDERVAREIDAL